jgi:dihydrofolate synthase/folylpolyglutamate synthase
MRFSSLQEWLNWQEGLHPSSIDLGLERVAEVFKRIHPSPPPCPVITVAGTNGKGSSVALLESIYQNAGYQTGAFTSPHLLGYNERIHLNGEEVLDDVICAAFERIDQARLQSDKEISLTYFEFGTLAALDIYFRAKPDVMILEVGLGGRLDVVNILDADVALITSIGIDHTAWLGNDRETIAKEKAGIMRKGKPVVFSSPDMPDSIATTAKEVAAILYQRGKDFDWKNGMGYAAWDWKSKKQQRTALPHSNLRGTHQLDNAAGVLMVIEQLAHKLSVNQKQIKDGLLSVSVPGRFQCQPGNPMHVLDVAHNEASMVCLAELLNSQVCGGNNVAVLGMLEDKAHTAALAVMLPEITRWYVADLDVPRGAKSEYLATVLKDLDKNTVVSCFKSVKQAIEAADASTEMGDRVIVFGSFHTVELAMQLGI